MDGVGEVTAFLTKLGLEQCVQAVVHNGFYTSMEALRGATYEEAPSHAQPVPVPRADAHYSHFSGHCTGPWPARAADGTASPFTDPSRRRTLAGRLWRPARPRQADAQRALQRGAVDGAPLGER